MIICPPDCPKRTQGCHSNCEVYEKNLADYRKRREYLDKDRDYYNYKNDTITRTLNNEAKLKQEDRMYGNRSRRLRGR